MRARLVALAFLLAASRANADAKLKDLATGYEREAAACHVHADGLAKVATGTAALVEAGQKQLQPDLDKLDDGLAKVRAYCDELAATLELINGNPTATYKSLEHQLDDHDNKIRKLRQASKKTLDDLEPILQRMIPQINARVEAPQAPKKLPGKFPSGHTVELPSLPGTWKVSGTHSYDTAEYGDGKLSSSITVRAFSGATCDQQRRTIKDEHTTDVPPSDDTKPLGLEWYVSYTRGDRRLRVACAMTKTGGLVATIDEPNAEWPALEPVMAHMIAAFN